MTLIALILTLVLLIKALTTNVQQRVFQVVIWGGFALTQLLVLCDVNKNISGIVLTVTTVVMASMYYSKYHYDKQKNEP